MDSTHPSYRWTSYARAATPGATADLPRFRELMSHPRYERSSRYDPVWVRANALGPHPLWLVEHLSGAMDLRPGARVLDLGCGAAITSIFLAREFGVQVWAADLWVEPTENFQRVVETDVGHSVFPMRLEAHTLPFPHGFFDAVVSVGTFHYFGTEMRYLSYLAQFVRAGGRIGMISPGNGVDPDDSDPPVTLDEAPNGVDFFTFRSPDWWRRLWTRSPGLKVEVSEMVDGGRELWLRNLEANAAFRGGAVGGDIAILESPVGDALGFVNVVARVEQAVQGQFGPGYYASRIA